MSKAIHIRRSSLLALAGLGAVLGLAHRAPAALLNGSVTTSAPTSVDLTSDGTVDWAIWDYQTSSTGTSGAPSNRKAGGTAIGSASALLGTPRGISGTSAPPKYTYTNGTAPVSATAVSIGALTDTSINATNSGFMLSIAGNPSQAETVKIVVDAYNAIGNFTATLNGATTYTDSSLNSSASSRLPAVYTLTFQPDTAADLLTIKYSIGTLTGNGSSNVDLQAVSVAPEPGAAGLLCAAAAATLLRRRRQAR